MGGYERPAGPAFLPDGETRFERIPPDFNGRLLEDDWERFEEIVHNSRRRVPQMEDVKVTRMINGPEAFTPDNEFCLGETEVRGLFVAAGFCAHGLAGAGGIGKVMAEWIAGGEPSIDLWHMDVRRFGAQYRSPGYTLERIRETYETYYDISYPGHEREAGRPLRVSPADAWHREHEAAFGEKSGWERVNWYESNAGAGDESLRPRGWAGRHWSPAIGAEHAACRERVAIFDESSFSKMEIAGPGAAALLERLCDNRVAREVGQDHLHPDAERARRDRVRLHGGAAGRGALLDRHRHRLRQPRPRVDPPPPAGDGSVEVQDVTSPGPASASGARAPATCSAAHPPGPGERGASPTCRSARSRSATCRCARCGSPTWASSAGSSTARPSTGWPCGARSGRRAAARAVAGGYRAIDSMRLEKGYRVWGADITPDETPVRGRRGLLREARQGRSSAARPWSRPRSAGRVALSCLLLEDPHSVALGNEPVRVDGEIARPRDHRRLRLHRGPLDRLRLPASRTTPSRARGWRSRSSAAGWRARWRASRCSTRGRAGTRVSASRPYDEAYDDDGSPRPHYAELLARARRPGAPGRARRGRAAQPRGHLRRLPRRLLRARPGAAAARRGEWSELGAASPSGCARSTRSGRRLRRRRGSSRRAWFRARSSRARRTTSQPCAARRPALGRHRRARRGARPRRALPA